MGVKFFEHKYLGSVGSGTNIIVPSRKKKEILIGSHYDAVPNSPGANDNASAVAVTFGLIERFKLSPPKNVGVRCCFFDQEEEGLVGSQAYLQKYGLENVVGFYNLELVGKGNNFVLWPTKEGDEGLLLDSFEKSCLENGTFSFRFPKPTINDADHRSFRKAGLKEAFTITCVTNEDLVLAKKMLAYPEKTLEIMEQSPVFKHYHKPTDRACYLNEGTLQLTTDLIYSSIRQLDAKL